jgi:hypothetical protein
VNKKVEYHLDTRLTDGGEVVSLTRRQRSTPHKHFMALVSVRGGINPRAMARLEVLSRLKKNPRALGFEPATFRRACLPDFTSLRPI